jgi:hypothetical protein
MPSQLFKQQPSPELLVNLLKSNCSKEGEIYILNNAAYKKGLYNNSIVEFFKFLEPHYHNSKKKYVTNKITYNSFVTVMRQVCKTNNISYTSKIKYDCSVYDIVYYIEI